MIRRTARIALEAVIGAIAVVVLVTGLAVWRLTEGPVDLDFLTPQIEAALSDPQTGVQVRIGVTQLTWEGWRRALGLHVRQVRVRDRDGALVAALPDVVMRLSLRALVRGVVAPTRVEVFGARIRAVRHADGSFKFGPWEGAVDEMEDAAEATGGSSEAAPPGSEDNDFSRMMPDLLAELLNRPTVEDPLSFLRVLRISGGRVRVDDRRLGLVWRAPFADIELHRDAEGLSGEMTLKVDWRGRQMSLLALLDYGRASNQMDIVARFSDLPPEVIATLAPGLSGVGGLTMLFAGSVSVTMGLDGVVSGLDFDIRGGAGEFAASDLFEHPVAVRDLRVTGQASNKGRRLHLSDATIDLGTEDAPGPEVALTGTITSAGQGLRGDLEIDAQASATGVPMAKLAQYWPLGIAPNPRAWVVENIPKGTTEKATVSVGLSVPDGDFDAAEVRQVEGTLKYDGLEVHYLRPLPPVTGVAGDATFDGDRFTFHTKGGRLGTLKIQDSAIGIAGLSLGREVMTIDLPVTGPLRDAMKVLDHDRLRLIRKLALDPADVSGLLAARVGFKFPLLKDLSFDEIDVAASANLADVALRRIFLGLDATDGQFTLSLDKAGMRLVGPLRLGGVPIEADWTETFTAKAPERTRIEAKVPRLDAAARDKFGLPLEPYLTGPISAHVIARRDRAGNSTVQAAVNLQDATMDAAPLLWNKPAGAPGEATFALELVGNRLTRLSDFQVTAGGMSAKGSAVFDAEGTRVEKVDLTELTVNGSRLTDISVALAKDGIGVQVGGGILDATPWIEEAEAPVPASPTAAPSGVPSTPMHLSAPKLNALLFGPERYLEGVSIDLVRNRGGWERIALNGSVPKALWKSPKGGSGADVSGASPKTLRVEFGPDPAGGTRFLAKAEDMGAVLRALDALDTINGGELEITGKSDGPLPYTPLTGRIEAKDFVLVGASGMAKLLTVASLTGIRDTLNGAGIRFDHLTGAYTLDDGIVHTDLLRAYGPAIGVTAKGEVDIDRAETKLQGTIVPAYTVNRILGGIPVLGPLLTGGEGEGIFAATYRVSGPLGDPKVDVNALSAIAPGFLRALFSSDAEPTALPPRTEP